MIQGGNNFFDSMPVDIRHAAMNGHSTDDELLASKMDSSSAIVTNQSNLNIVLNGSITFKTTKSLAERGIILKNNEAIACVIVNGTTSSETQLNLNAHDLNSITYDTTASGEYIKSRITTNRYTKTVVDDSLNRVHYISLIPTNYSHVVINSTTVSNPTPVIMKLIDTRAVSLAGVGSAKAFLMLTWTFDASMNTTVKTKDGKDLKVRLTGVPESDNAVYPVNVTINISGYDLVGEVDGVVNSTNVVTSSDINTLKSALSSLLSDVTLLNKLYEASKTLSLSDKPTDGSKNLDLDVVLQRLVAGDIDDDLVMSVFTILCNFGDKIGVPWVKQLSNIMTVIYTSLKDKEINFTTTKNNGGTINAYQGMNAAFLKSAMSESGLITRLNNKLKLKYGKNASLLHAKVGYSQNDFEADIQSILNQMQSGNGKYCVAMMFMSSAFGITELASVIGMNFSEALAQMKPFLSLYPVHVHVIIDEIDPNNPNDPHRVARIDVGMDFGQQFVQSGLFSLGQNFFSFESYMSDNKPPIVKQREATFESEMLLKAKTTIVNFEQCLALAEIAKNVLPAYSVQSTCQQQTALFWEAITESVEGLLSMID